MPEEKRIRVATMNYGLWNDGITKYVEDEKAPQGEPLRRFFELLIARCYDKGAFSKNARYPRRSPVSKCVPPSLTFADGSSAFVR